MEFTEHRNKATADLNILLYLREIKTTYQCTKLSRKKPIVRGCGLICLWYEVLVSDQRNRLNEFTITIL